MSGAVAHGGAYKSYELSLEIGAPLGLVVAHWKEIFAARTDTRGSFAAKQRQLRIGFPHFAILCGFVVVTEDFDLFLETVEPGAPVVAPGCDGPGGVLRADNRGKFGGNFMALGRALFGNLVANAPKDYRRMVSVAAHQRAPDPLVPIRKKHMVVIFLFALTQQSKASSMTTMPS